MPYTRSRMVWKAVPVILAGLIRTGQADVRWSEGQKVADFVAEAAYQDQAGHTQGGRFRHAPTGLVLDLLTIQSVPQAFIWVNTPPPSDQGEPHTCEHLLLGKGTKGRYVASLESMCLGASSAFTNQLQTCYHFNTTAGADIFFKLMEAKLDALLHPSFSDEEIRREVCNVGYRVLPSDSSLELEEKGTVYNEMVSSFERPWYHLSRALDRMLYGPGHPLSNSSGGDPDFIRTMTPEDLRIFHSEQYRLGNMGIIMALPNEMPIRDALVRMSTILSRVQPHSELGSDPTTLDSRLPAPRGAEPGRLEVTRFPHANPEEPGLLVYAWPARLHLTDRERLVLELLLENVAGDETSDLYALFIDSETRRFDLGATDVSSWVSADVGQPIYIAFENVRRSSTDPVRMDSVRELIRERFAEIGGWAHDAPKLAAFNVRAQGRILERRRSLSEFLNSPPAFGMRNTYSQWLIHLKRLQGEDSFERSLSLDPEFEFATELLKSGKNFWREYISKAGLTEIPPFAVGAQADPGLLAETEQERTARLGQFLADLVRQYGVGSDDEAKQRYRQDYDAQTAEIDLTARSISMPAFVDSPPLSVDPQLVFAFDTTVGGIPVVTSLFENISSGHMGVALGLDAVGEPRQMYIPALPTLLSDVGVVSDGKPLPYDAMKEAMRREILSFSVGFSVNHRTERAELVLKAAGNSHDEGVLAAIWLKRALLSADWRPENLPRLRDAVDLALKSKRNTMRQREEDWVQDPARAYVSQYNSRLLLADCFLTQIHALHRVGWLLLDPPSGLDLVAWRTFLETVGGWPEKYDRAALTEKLGKAAKGMDSAPGEIDHPESQLLAGMPSYSQKLARRALESLEQSLGDIPDGSLSGDWEYLCRQMDTDLMQPPEHALEELAQVRTELLHADNARVFVTGNTEMTRVLRAQLDSLLATFSTRVSSRAARHGQAHVSLRVRTRTSLTRDPLFVGLVNENTRSGVFVNTTGCASYEDTDPERLLDFLTARLYGGGGAHSMFMKTWSAGLAYSNGFRSNESSGRLSYYAERCPDLSQTMQFVVNELSHAPYDTTLAEYAVAGVFSNMRSGRRYEDRSEAMASDLADGVTPDVVKDFRQGILALRDQGNLYAELHERMPAVYGQVLPGYGPKASETPGSSCFLIGPESQLTSYETYLKSVESPDAEVVRLYARDFWIPADAP